MAVRIRSKQSKTMPAPGQLHTPGPWHAYVDLQCSPNEEIDTDVVYTSNSAVRRAPIARMIGLAGNSYADARLIASAPDLLRSLIEVLNKYSTEDEINRDPVIVRARLALTKATAGDRYPT